MALCFINISVSILGALKDKTLIQKIDEFLHYSAHSNRTADKTVASMQDHLLFNLKTFVDFGQVMKSFRRNLKSLHKKPFTDESGRATSSPTLVGHGIEEEKNVKKEEDEDGEDDKKGPLGLNLLHEPPNACVDFIFVHGLGGGSRKTWSLTEKAEHFWPKSWLPRDPAFKNVRIHSFGYSSNWFKGKDNAMNIQDFATSLLMGIKICPGFGDEDTPIVFIGHSMGGLVIKKAYMLARVDPFLESISRRIRSFHFIATPHSGSDSAELLTNIFHAVYNSCSYVSDLERGSSVIQDINAQFRLYARDLDIWSFYETLPLTVGGFSRMIVKKDSAMLGYQDEKQIPMTADHRSICKFKSTNDTNYKYLRNALASTVKSLTKSGQRLKEKQRYEQMKILREYLGVSEPPIDDLSAAQDSRLPGTCEWLSNKASYVKWQDFSSQVPIVYWLYGNPGAGKSVLAGYVIDTLKQTGLAVSYFFFKGGDESKSKLSTCLRSIAFQMASTSEQVKDMLLGMHEEDDKFDKRDERTIWRKVFMSGIFQAELSCQYWVIDALDECADFVTLFTSMLSKLNASMPLRILVTSRATAELQKQFTSLGTDNLYSERISAADTLGDIKLFVEEKSRSLEIDADHRSSLIDRILDKSKDSFLWTAIVLRELSNVHGERDINETLDEVPQEMEPLYFRILEAMSRATHGKRLAKAILAWSICSVRPMTVTELESALSLDLGDSFLYFRRSIAELCGQLVLVDGFGRVQMVHATAREFLVNNRLQSEFAINMEEAHARIAKTCLIYLTSKDLEPPPPSRRTPPISTPVTRSGFAAYALHSFSDHLAQSDLFADDVLDLLDTFLKHNILSWIQVIAETQDLTPLFNVAKNLNTYLDKISGVQPLEETRKQLIRGWSKDLIRIATKYGDAILSSPFAIHHAFLPLFPKDSTAYRAAIDNGSLSVIGRSRASEPFVFQTLTARKSETFSVRINELIINLAAKLRDLIHIFLFYIYHLFFPRCTETPIEGREVTISRGGLSLVGNSNNKWDDLLCYLKFKDFEGTVLSHGDNYFAIGFKSGQIVLYHGTTYRQSRVLDNGTAANLLAFKAGTDLMASSCGRPDRTSYDIKVWDISNGEIMHALQCRDVPVWLGFYEDILMVVCENNCISLWDIADGCRETIIPLGNSEQFENTNEATVSAVSIAADGKTLALGYTGNRPVILWNPEKMMIFASCDVDPDNSKIEGVRHLLFDPSHNNERLLICYDTNDGTSVDSEFKIINPLTNQVLRRVRQRGRASSLAASPDGRTLITTGPGVYVLFYDFEALGLITFIKTDIYDTLSVVWGNDSQHFFEFCERHCLIWEPAILAPGCEWVCLPEELPSTVKSLPLKRDGLTRSLLIDPTGKFAFRGDDDGTVALYELETGTRVRPFYRIGDDHANSSANALGWWPEGSVLTSFHNPNAYRGWLSSTSLCKTSQWEKDGWEVVQDSGFFIELPCEASASPVQLLIGPDGESLVATPCNSFLVSIDGQVLANERLGDMKWIQHPSSPRYIIGIKYLPGGRSAINIHTWSGLTLLSCVHLGIDISPAQAFSGHFYGVWENHMLVILRPSGFFLDMSLLKAEEDNGEVSLPPIERIALAEMVAFVVGIWKSKFVFCNKDGWICSTELQALDGPYQRHFYFPKDWINEINPRCAITTKGDIVFGLRSELMVVKGGLDYVDRDEILASSSSASSLTAVERPLYSNSFPTSVAGGIGRSIYG
ncbi:hypothetical protein AJ79_08787 [Helicocarpus griseus UAMH5409]|uniref:DUF676 domain-containing protein n=1 Tax=Helicocarpus griseus UAMH5409 TaxID=1447875 RepID=A0A2B7WQD7_9EURO|nr:hypothetical protein AJ79_08787 [Helicocarpus griseus UAMH5409]